MFSAEGKLKKGKKEKKNILSEKEMERERVNNNLLIWHYALAKGKRLINSTKKKFIKCLYFGLDSLSFTFLRASILSQIDN